METFGDRLRIERESRGLSIPGVSETLGIEIDTLAALERNEFDTLPDEATMSACLRAYAACLEVDAELMIEDYERERARCLRELALGLDRQVLRPSRPVLPAADGGRSPWLSWVLGCVILLAASVAGWLMVSRESGSPVGQSPTIAAPAETSATSSAATAAPAPVVGAPASVAVESSEQRLERAPQEHAGLVVSESGVGSGVVQRELVGRSQRFSEGSRVWFWTRVQGGRNGDRIDHVWLRDGVEVTRVPLAIGAESWRTYSAKTLHPGSAGRWAVEARDESGRTLARSEFDCLP